MIGYTLAGWIRVVLILCRFGKSNVDKVNTVCGESIDTTRIGL